MTPGPCSSWAAGPGSWRGGFWPRCFPEPRPISAVTSVLGWSSWPVGRWLCGLHAPKWSNSMARFPCRVTTAPLTLRGRLRTRPPRARLRQGCSARCPPASRGGRFVVYQQPHHGDYLDGASCLDGMDGTVAPRAASGRGMPADQCPGPPRTRMAGARRRRGRGLGSALRGTDRDSGLHLGGWGADGTSGAGSTGAVTAHAAPR